MTSALQPLMLGAAAALSWIAGLFFLRFWRESRDRLFLFLSVAFWMLAIGWAALALVPTKEGTPYLYLPRLFAFVLIIAGVIDKNRRSRAER